MTVRGKARAGKTASLAPRIVPTNEYTIRDIRALCKRYNNWGRWGGGDKLGTMNFVTPQEILRALQMPRRGKVISCALPFDERGPQTGGGGRINPLRLMILEHGSYTSGAVKLPGGFRYADDVVTMPLQGGTQWDALGHVWWDDEKLYNGVPASTVNSTGATVLGIENYARIGVISRGILLDFPRYFGVPALARGQVIHRQDVEDCVKAQGLKVESGDIVLYRTGHMKEFLDSNNNPAKYQGPVAGFGLDVAGWLYDNQVAASANDTWSWEVSPNETTQVVQPLHLVCLVNMGLLIGEIFNFEELAEDCARDGKYDFLFVAPPLPFTRGVGSPLNPLAIK